MAYHKGVGEQINEMRKLKKKSEKVQWLRDNANPTMLALLKSAYEPAIVWALPDGIPPYKPLDKSHDAQGMLKSELRRLYLFWEGGNPNLSQIRREQLFIELLEALDPDDAKLVLEAKEGHIKGLTKEAVKEAFPNLLDGRW